MKKNKTFSNFTKIFALAYMVIFVSIGLGLYIHYQWISDKMDKQIADSKNLQIRFTEKEAEWLFKDTDLTSPKNETGSTK